MAAQRPNKERDWTRILAIVFGVIFAFMFVGTYILSILGYTIFSPPVKPGDTVVIGLTIRDASGRPVLTTDQKEYSRALTAGERIFFTQSLQLTANETYSEKIVGIDAYTPPRWTKFGLLRSELELISRGVVGMKEGETRSIDLATAAPPEEYLSADEFELLVGNFSSIEAGEQIIMVPLSYLGEMDLNTSASYYYRVMEISGKDDGGVRMSHAYTTAEITLMKRA